METPDPPTKSTHPSSPTLISCVDFRIEPYTKMAALAEWLRVGLWQLGEPFKYHGKVYYKIDRQNPPHFAIADADEGDPTGNETVVQMYAFLHDCEPGPAASKERYRLRNQPRGGKPQEPQARVPQGSVIHEKKSKTFILGCMCFHLPTWKQPRNKQ